MSQRIKLLRQALGDPSASPRYVGNVRGEGYRLIAEVTTVAEQRFQVKKLVPWTAGAGAALVGLAVLIFLPRASDAPDASENVAGVSASLSAGDLVARGRDYLTRGSREANENALRLFAQAREVEQDNVDAITGLSFAYSHRATKYDFGKDAALEAEALAREALAKGPQKALSWHALGFSLDAQGRVSEALRAYEQAIAINPDDVGATSSAAYLMQVQGRLHEALLLEAQALERGAPTLFSSLQIASALRLAGLDVAAERWLTRARTLTPDNLLLVDIETEFLLSAGEFRDAAEISAPGQDGAQRAAVAVQHGEALLGLGDADGAAAAFAAAAQSNSDYQEGAFESAALALAEKEALQLSDDHPLLVSLRKMRAEGDEWPFASVQGAYIFAAVGDADGAAALLEEARILGFRDAQRISHSPFFANLHGAPAFIAVFARMQEDAAVQRALIEKDPRLRAIINAN